MSVKPHRSTVDQLIDRFDQFDVPTQERVLDSLALVHRLAKRRVSLFGAAGKNSGRAPDEDGEPIFYTGELKETNE
jgi:hypothetical protein